MRSKGSVLGSLCGRPIGLRENLFNWDNGHGTSISFCWDRVNNYLITWYVAREGRINMWLKSKVNKSLKRAVVGGCIIKDWVDRYWWLVELDWMDDWLVDWLIGWLVGSCVKWKRMVMIMVEFLGRKVCLWRLFWYSKSEDWRKKTWEKERTGDGSSDEDLDRGSPKIKRLSLIPFP